MSNQGFHPVLSSTEEVERLLMVSDNLKDVHFVVDNSPPGVLTEAILNLVYELRDTRDRLSSYVSDSYH